MKKYDTYKDSGIEWLGEIPKHWKVVKVKHVLKNLNSFRVPLSSVERANMKERIYDYYGASGVIDKVENYIFEGENILIGEDGANLLSRSKRLAFIASGKYWVNNHAHILKPREGNITYFSELMEIYDYTPLIVGAAQPKLTQDSLMNIEIIEPPISEQNLIAFYLNHKTTQIDTLIEKKEQLVEKLTLKRQAIINEAVTKGLNPDVPMKDSGIEWLGEIPEHWEVVSLKYLVNHSTTKGNGKSKLKVALENIESQTGVYLESEKKEFEGELKEFKKDDILFNKLRPYLAKVFKAPEDGECVSELLVFTCLSPVLIPDFLFWKLISQQIISVVDSSTYGAKMPRVGTDFMLNLPIALPLKDEQEGIIKHIADKIKIIDATSEKAKESIEKLKLYRQSLISEAVTGKIDLRDWKQTDNK